MKIALVEIGGSHDECLYSQIRFLNDSTSVQLTLICNERLREHVRHFDGLEKTHFVRIRSNPIYQWVDLFNLWRFFQKESYDHIIFNTAQGGVMKRLLLFPFPDRQNLSGTIHNIGKLHSSTGQKIISSKMGRYFVLNEYLLENLGEELADRYNVGVYYPIFYPDYPVKSYLKKKGEIWICIPGQVEYKRRDYEGFLDRLAKGKVGEHLKFLLLGRCEHAMGDGSKVKGRINDLGLEDQFMLWDGFIDPIEFYNRIRYSDYIMPLIHSSHESHRLYSEQISGAFNLGFGFRKPFLMEDGFSVYSDFQDNAVFYKLNNMIEVLNGMDVPDTSRYYQNEKWSFDYQKENYLLQLGI